MLKLRTNQSYSTPRIISTFMRVLVVRWVVTSVRYVLLIWNYDIIKSFIALYLCLWQILFEVVCVKVEKSNESMESLQDYVLYIFQI